MTIQLIPSVSIKGNRCRQGQLPAGAIARDADRHPSTTKPQPTVNKASEKGQVRTHEGAPCRKRTNSVARALTAAANNRQARVRRRRDHGSGAQANKGLSIPDAIGAVAPADSNASPSGPAGTKRRQSRHSRSHLTTTKPGTKKSGKVIEIAPAIVCHP
jgi:hypothetical protein